MQKYAVALLFASAVLAHSGGALAQTATASVYAKKFDGRTTASGRVYRHWDMSLAHRTLPFGTLVDIRRCKAAHGVVAPVTDRGPFVRGRTFDLSGGIARALGVGGLPCVAYRVVSRPASLRR